MHRATAGASWERIFRAHCTASPTTSSSFSEAENPIFCTTLLGKIWEALFSNPQESTPSSFLRERLHSLPRRKDPGNLRGHLFGTQCSRAWHTLSPMILEAMVPLARNVRKLSPTPHSSNKSELPERSMLAWARPHERQVGPC